MTGTIRVTQTVDLTPEARKARAAYKAVDDQALAQLSDFHPTLGKAARDHHDEVAEVIAMLPCTLGALDAHADNNGWCSTWTRLRDDAISEGMLVVVVEAPAEVTE